MLNINMVLFFILITNISLFSLGFGLKKMLKLNCNDYYNIPLGFGLFIGILNLLVYPFVLLRLPTSTYYLVILVLLILPNVSLIWYRFKRLNIINIALMTVVFAILVYITYNRALAEQSFDTIHYMSYIIEAANSDFLTQYSVGGLVRESISSLNDFSSYFYFLGFIHNVSERVITFFSSDIQLLSMPITLWYSTILYFVISLSLTFATFTQLKIKSLFHKIVILLLIHLFIGAFYYNTVFAFYGNTYRTLYAGVLSFLIFTIFEKKSIQLGSDFCDFNDCFCRSGALDQPDEETRNTVSAKI